MKDIKIKLVVEGDSKEAIKGLDTLTDKEKQVAENFKKIQKEANKAEKEVKDAANTAKKSFAGLNDQLADLGQTILGAFAVEALIQFGKESVLAFAEAEEGARKLEFAVKNIANGSTGALDRLLNQAEELKGVSIFDDDDIIAAQQALITYGLTTDQVERLIPRIVDLASATGEDLVQSTDRVISAINGQSRGLKDVGLQFKDTGDKAKNYEKILEGLNKFQGATTEAADTTSGAMKRFQIAIGDVMENTGEMLVDIGNGFAFLWDSIVNGSQPAINAINATEEELKQMADSMVKLGVISDLAVASEAELAAARKANVEQLAKIQEEYKFSDVQINETVGKFQKDRIDAIDAEIQRRKDLQIELDKQKKTWAAEKEVAKKKKEEKKEEISAYQRLVQSIQQLEAAQLDYIAMTGDFNLGIKQTIDGLKAKKQAIDDLVKEYDKLGKAIETTYEAEQVEEPKLREGIRQTAKTREDLMEARKIAEQEFFNLAFQLNDMLYRQQSEQLRASTQAQIDAYEQVKNERLAQEGITQKKREEYERAFQAQKLAIQKAAFEREKQLQVRQALMAGALAVVKTFASYGGFTPPALIAAAAQAAQTAIQIGVIQAQKFEKGGWIDGKRHSEGGTLIEAERDEFVVNRKDAMKQSELLEAINKGQAEAYIMKKFVLPAVVSKSMAQVQSETLADRIADSLKYQMFDDHRLRKTIQESTKQSAYYIVDGLKRSQKPTRYN